MSVLVTGTSRGLGLATARALVERGHAVIGAQRGASASEPGIVQVLADLGTELGIARVVEACPASSLRGAVFNAGVVLDGAFEAVADPGGEDPIDLHLRLDLAAPLKLLRALLRADALAVGASVVFVGSNLARHGIAGKVAYAAAKAGIEGAVRGLARELGPRRMRVNAVAPGLVRTDMTAALGDEGYAAYAREVPIGRVGEPADVAGVIMFLLADAASYVSGQVIDVDGGWGC
ncbi:SDR family NAD(P)-dependent oxidoreductase [Nannocystaceae bacterium ST9]